MGWLVPTPLRLMQADHQHRHHSGQTTSLQWSSMLSSDRPHTHELLSAPSRPDRDVATMHRG